MSWWWDPFCSDQHTELEFYIASSLKQQSAGRHAAPLGYIILIPSQPVFALSPYFCMLSGEATNTNFIVFGLTRSGLEPTIYCTRGEHANHYTTNAVSHLIRYYWEITHLELNDNQLLSLKKTRNSFKLFTVNITGMIYFSYLTDFSYFPMEIVFRKLLDTVRTGQNWPVWKGV